MKIATWNVERLKHKSSLRQIICLCEKVKADILVLTESDEQIKLSYPYCVQTPTPLPPSPDQNRLPVYKPTEHRVSIFSRYPVVQLHQTFNHYTALCAELKTEQGTLLVYGTILGILGNRDPSYQQDLLRQLEDYQRLAQKNNFCICGDLNCSFSDGYYFTKTARNLLLDSFQVNRMELLTEKSSCCVDHIVLSKAFLLGREVRIKEWNLDKAFSDHKGIAVDF